MRASGLGMHVSRVYHEHVAMHVCEEHVDVYVYVYVLTHMFMLMLILDLSREIAMLREDYQQYDVQMEEAKEQMMSLEEENEKLKKQVKKVRYACGCGKDGMVEQA